MYKIVRQNDSSYRKGEIITDKQFYEDDRRIRAEGGIRPSARHIPKNKFLIHNRNTGQFLESYDKFRSPDTALSTAFDTLVRDMYTGFDRHDGYRVSVFRDGSAYLEVDVRYIV